MEYPKLEELNCSNCTERSIEKHYPEFWKYIVTNYHCEKWTERLYWFYHNLTDYPKCKVCGNPTQFINIKTGYREFCGYKCMNSCSDIQTRKKETSKNNWGTDNPMQSKQVRDKLKETIRERYGVDNPFQMKDFEEKRKATNLKKYGVPHHLQNDKIKSKLIKTQYKQNINNDLNLIGYNENGWQIRKCPHSNCDKCSLKFYTTPANIYFDRNRLGYETCTTLAPIDNHRCKNTTIELFIRELLEEYDVEYDANVRDIISPKELDIYIPSKQIAIECNGIYSHSIKYKKTSYHINKTIECRNNGIELIHIWEDWVKTKPEIVKSMILNKLGLLKNDIIYARKCEIKEVPAVICNQFLEQNHIQGKSQSSIKYGLYYNNELVSVMTFSKPRVNMGGKNHRCQWELVRFCSKLNTRIVGGASKLLNHFIKHQSPDTIVSFSSSDISSGNLYKQLGFISDNKTTQSYWYIDPKTMKRYHRTSFTKNSIVERGWKDKVDNTWTERQVMEEQGYFCIYDSGQFKWILDLSNKKENR